MTEIVSISILLTLMVFWAIVPEIKWLYTDIRSRTNKPKKVCLRLIKGEKEEQNADQIQITSYRR